MLPTKSNRGRLPLPNEILKVGRGCLHHPFQENMAFKMSNPTLMALSLKSWKWCNVTKSRSHALSLSHYTSLLNWKEDKKRDQNKQTNIKHYTEQYIVLLVPGGKTEPKMLVSWWNAEATLSIFFFFYRNQRNPIPLRWALGPKTTRGIQSHAKRPACLLRYPTCGPPACLLRLYTGSYRFWSHLLKDV